MYPYLKNKIVAIKGLDAYGIYDLNYGKFYRLNNEAGEFLINLTGEKSINEYSENEKEFIKISEDKDLISYSKNKTKTNPTKLEEVLASRRKTKFAWIEITSLCNQNCLHCFLGEDLNKYSHKDIEEIKSSIDFLVNDGMNQLILSGGEPLLHPNINEIIGYASKYNINITLLTNGTIDFSEKLLDLLKKNGIEIKMSLLGWGESHNKMTNTPNSFNKVLNSIELLLDNDINIQLGCTVSAINYKDVDKIRAYANQKRIKLEVSPLFAIGQAVHNKDVLFAINQKEINEVCKLDKKYVIKDIRKFSKPERFIKDKNKTDYDSFCLKDSLTDSHECGQKVLALLCNNNVSPCLLLRDSNYTMGSLMDNTLEDIIIGDSERKKIFNETMKISNIKTCNLCEARFACKGGGCIASSLALAGSIHEKNPYYEKCYYKQSVPIK